MKAFGWWMSCALVHTCALSPHTHPHTGGGARGCRSSSAAAAPRGPPWQWGITARPGSAPPPAGPHPGGGRLPPTHFARKLNCVSSSSEMRWEVLRSPRTARLSETVHCGPTPGPSFPRPAEILKHFQPDPGRGGPVSEPHDSRLEKGVPHVPPKRRSSCSEAPTSLGEPWRPAQAGPSGRPLARTTPTLRAGCRDSWDSRLPGCSHSSFAVHFLLMFKKSCCLSAFPADDGQRGANLLHRLEPPAPQWETLRSLVAALPPSLCPTVQAEDLCPCPVHSLKPSWDPPGYGAAGFPRSWNAQCRHSS